MTLTPEQCPDREYHGNPFRYCQFCSWMEPAPPPPPCEVCPRPAVTSRGLCQEHADEFEEWKRNKGLS